MEKRVSVIIPTYNRARFIGEALDSVLTQCTDEDEIIVVDDGSTDETREVLGGFGDRLRVISQEQRGPSAARNRGILESAGRLIAFQDSDDLWAPDKMRLQLNFTARHPEVDIVFGNMGNFSGSGFPESPEITHPEIYSYLQEHCASLDRMFEKLLQTDFVPLPTVLMKRCCLTRLGGFDEDLTIAEDYDLWLRAACLFRFGFVDSILVFRRRHEGNLINRFASRLSQQATVLEKFKGNASLMNEERIHLIDRTLSALYYDLGSFEFKKGQFAQAHAHLRRCTGEHRTKVKWRVKVTIAAAFKNLHAHSFETG